MSHVKILDFLSFFFLFFFLAFYLENASHYIQDVVGNGHARELIKSSLHNITWFLHIRPYFIIWVFIDFMYVHGINIYYIVFTWILHSCMFILHDFYIILQLLHDNYMTYQPLCHGIRFDTVSFCWSYAQPICSRFMRKSTQDHPPGWLQPSNSQAEAVRNTEIMMECNHFKDM
jgi:hypothetical protein